MKTETGTRVVEVAVETVRGWVSRNEVVLLDVREPMEHEAERIPGTRLWPLSAFDPAKLPSPEGTRLVLFCRTGRRSAEAGQRLLDAGFPEVYHLQGGILAWKEAGCPVESAAGGRSGARAPLDLMRQVQIASGSLVVLGTLLGALLAPGWLVVSGGVGAGLVYAGISGTCGMGMLLARMPWNRRPLRCEAQAGLGSGT